jgi:hypothetical protein
MPSRRRHRIMKPALASAILGVVSLPWAAGCHSDDSSYKEVPKGVRVKEAPATHQHADEGPHGGHLVELGDEEYHAEVVLDVKTKDVNVYILGSDAKTPVPIDAKEVKLDLTIAGKTQPHIAKPSPEKGDPSGTSSRFVLAGGPDIKAHVDDEHELEGNVSVTIKGKPYSGPITHEHGGHEDHPHAKQK